MKRDGWPAFRELERLSLDEVLAMHPENFIVSCGGGIVETEACRVRLKTWCAIGGQVVHLQRNVDDTIAYLATDASRPQFDENLMTVW